MRTESIGRRRMIRPHGSGYTTRMKGEQVMLFAKDADPDTSSIWLIAVGASLLLMFVFFIVLLFRHLRAVRQLTHTERIKNAVARSRISARSTGGNKNTGQVHAQCLLDFILVGIRCSVCRPFICLGGDDHFSPSGQTCLQQARHLVAGDSGGIGHFIAAR